MKGRHGIGRGEGAYIGFFIKRIAQFQAFHRAYEGVFEFVRNLLGHDKALRRDAGLPIVDHTRFDADLDRFVKICAGHDNKRVAAAEFEDDLFDPFCRPRSDLNSSSFAARQSRRRHARIFKDSVHLVGTDQKSLKGAFWKSGSQQNVFYFQRALGHI